MQDTFLNARIEIQEQTLGTLSRELHDSINAEILNIHLNLLNIKDDLENLTESSQAEVLPKLVETDQEVMDVMQELRQISKRLSAEYFDNFGLVRAIGQEITFINKTKHLTAELKVEGYEREFDKMKSLVLFRILQEALNNVKKHAEAKKIEVSLNYASDALHLLIADDGVGFDTNQLANHDGDDGAGLRNMKYRAEQIGAIFQIDSKPTKGTRIHIQFPLS
ncbi:MAG: hypothetical protein KF734_01280 [Saprospiraceae bacterium]|nr:hypothetical protein [Saprospiraceae bacterium]